MNRTFQQPASIPGMPTTVPPPNIPLSFLSLGGIGLLFLGIALVVNGPKLLTRPQSDPIIATTHLAMITFLTSSILGAAHQFIPVITQRPLRSLAMARLSFFLLLVGGCALPTGFFISNNGLVAIAGSVVVIAIALIVWNVSNALLVRGKGNPVVGLRMAFLFLLFTIGFGVTYAFDRVGGEHWLTLKTHIVLAHAYLGLVGWLGLGYIAVSEKLWPKY